PRRRHCPAQPPGGSGRAGHAGGALDPNAAGGCGAVRCSIDAGGHRPLPRGRIAPTRTVPVSMATFDLIILAIVLLSAVVGLVQGFLKEIASLVTWVLAFWLAWQYAPALAPHLGGTLSTEPHGIWAARAILFVSVLVAGA